MSISDIRIASVAVITISALSLLTLERMFPYVKTQRIIREGFIDDFISYNFLQTFILGIFISYLIELIDSTSGISRLQLITDWSIWLQVFLFIITHDFYIYVFHKWQHKNKYLWRLHEAHHSPKEVDWLSGVRSHALEILINQTVEFLPIVLLGSPPEVAVYQATISAVWGMYIHSNIDVHTGKLQYVINGPEMHRWHHSTGKGRNRNFSTKLAIWDWIFGTAYLPEEKAAEYGLKTYFPGNYFKQLAFAFRSFKKRERV